MKKRIIMGMAIAAITAVTSMGALAAETDYSYIAGSANGSQYESVDERVDAESYGFRKSEGRNADKSGYGFRKGGDLDARLEAREFAVRTSLPPFKRFLFCMAGRKYDRMASAKNQSYYFIFVHEDGEGLRKISRIFDENKVEASVDEVFGIDDVNAALNKVASGGSRGKTIIKF